MSPRSMFGVVGLSMLLITGAAPTSNTAIAGPKVKHCPPGLAKKGSCVPPGHRKKWYKGDRLPDDAEYREVYYDDYDLDRPDLGQIYIETGGQIYLLAEATKRIIEAINLVGAASN